MVFGIVMMMSMLMQACVTMRDASEPLRPPEQLASEELNTTERFRKYKAVGIRPFTTDGAMLLNTNADEKSEMESFKNAAPSYLINGFNDEMKDNFYKRYGTILGDGDPKEYDLIIEGKFIELDRGNAAGRFWGVGGNTRVMVDGTMTETATGKVVARFRDFKIGTGNIGTENMMERNCKEIGGNISDFLRDCY